MTAKSSEWPAFDSSLLQNISTAFRARRRAIRYHGSIRCSTEFDGDSERLNVDYRGLSPLGLQLRLSVWAEGQMWLRACVPGPGRAGGWAFLCHFYGDISRLPPAEVVQLYEQTLSIGTTHSSGEEEIRKVWRVVGPRSGTSFVPDEVQ